MKEYIVKVNNNGDKYWYLNDLLHREDGPAIEYAKGDKYWFLNGQLHREDGPAVEYAKGDKCWYLNDKLHRIDGPAIEYSNGNKVWFLNDKQYTESQYKEEMSKRNNTCNGKIVEIDGKKYQLKEI